MVMADDTGNIGYAGAVQGYWELGWRAPLPLKRATKKPIPSVKCETARLASHPAGCADCIHYSGYVGVDPSWPDIMAWTENFPDGNLALRLPDGIIGIDVDAYGAKTGADAIAEATKRWGPLPFSPRSSSRPGDLTSGIRLFRVPPGTTLETRIGFPDLGIGDIEIIQRHHRYVICWPSIHPEGRGYVWRGHDDELVDTPTPAALPDLPPAWIEGLKVVARTQFDGPIDFNIQQALTAGEPSFKVSERLRQAIKELQLPGASRHETCIRHVMAIARLGKSGEPGVKPALQLLCSVLIAARQIDQSGTEEETRAEFIRMLTNDNIARELSKPGIVNWVDEMLRQLMLKGLETVHVEEYQSPPSTSEGGDQGPTADTSGSVVPDLTRPKSHLEEIERGFWQSRDSLAMVYQTALARMASPWAVLGICAARALTQVRPNVTLPPLIGGPGSLNWFVALVARSGGGKGAANAASNLLIPKSTFKQRTLGSGEGLVKLFDRPKNAEPGDDVNEAVLVNVDEVDTLTALSQRSASTTIAVLKQAFSGEALGFTYVNRSGVRDVEDHGYRMTLVVSVQPKKSGGMFADEGGGLPQRFMWLPAGDKRITTDERWPSGPLTLPAPGEWLYPREIIIPIEAAALIKEQRKKNAHEELDAIDGHALFCREKFAYALAVLDGRVHMTSEDWELSGIAADVSDYTRQSCVDQLYEAARLDAAERGALRGIEMEAADVEKLDEQVKRGQRVMKWLLHKLDEAPDGFLTQSDLMQRISSRDRKTLGDILASGNQLLRGVLVDGAVRWSRG